MEWSPEFEALMGEWIEHLVGTKEKEREVLLDHIRLPMDLMGRVYVVAAWDGADLNAIVHNAFVDYLNQRYPAYLAAHKDGEADSGAGA